MWADDGAVWQSPLNVSNSGGKAINPQVVLDSSGLSHIFWEEAQEIQYSQCMSGGCSAPLTISDVPTCAATANAHTAPTAAIDDAGNIMVVWQADNDKLLYRSWPGAAQNPTNPVDCVPYTGSQPQLAAGQNNNFALVYIAGDNDDGAVQAAEFSGSIWENPFPSAGDGRFPNIYLDDQNIAHLAWCSSDNVLRYATNSGSETISTLGCNSQPQIAQDDMGTIHLIWFGNKVVDVNNRGVLVGLRRDGPRPGRNHAGTATRPLEGTRGKT
jgi:hypothetical protein